MTNRRAARTFTAVLLAAFAVHAADAAALSACQPDLSGANSRLVTTANAQDFRQGSFASSLVQRWDFQDAVQLYNISAGTEVHLKCLKATNVALAPPTGAVFLRPTVLNLATTASIVLESTELQTSCSTLAAYQAYLCGVSQLPGSVTSTISWVYFNSWQAPGVSLTNVNVSCVSSTPPVPPCQFFCASNSSTLLDIFQNKQLPNISMTVQITANFSIARPNWPAVAVPIVSNVTMLPKYTFERLVVDFQLNVDLFNLNNGSYITIRNLTLVNLAPSYFSPVYGYSHFAVLSYRVWAFTRLAQQVILVGVNLVVPSEELDYLTYWVDRYLSPVPEYAKSAQWLQASNLSVSSFSPTNIVIASSTYPTIITRNCQLTANLDGYPIMPQTPRIKQLTDLRVPLTAVFPVNSEADLLYSLNKTSNITVEIGYRYILVISNFTIGSSAWPAAGYPVPGKLYIGRGPGQGCVQLSFNHRMNLFNLTSTGTVLLSDVALSDLPVLASRYNPAAPMHVMVTPLWPFWARDGSRQIQLANTTIHVNPDEMGVLLEAHSDVAHAFSNADRTLIAAIMGFFGSSTATFDAAQPTYMRIAQVTTSRYSVNNVKFVVPPALLASGFVGNLSALGVPFRGKPKGLAAWAIALIVVGSVAGLVLLGMAAFCVRQRRQARNSPKLKLYMSKEDQLELGRKSSDQHQDAAKGEVHSSQGTTVSANFTSTSLKQTHLSSGNSPHAGSLRPTSNTYPGGFIMSSVSQANDSFNQPPDSYCHAANQSGFVRTQSVPSSAGASARSNGNGSHNPGRDAGNLSANPSVDQLHGVITQMGREINDHQLVISVILGKGAFGTVYRGTWRGLEVAVKAMMFPQEEGQKDQQRALLEAAISANLAHPNIVITYAYELKPMHSLQDMQFLTPDLAQQNTGWRLCLIQEYCNGGTLREIIDKNFFAAPTASQPSIAAAGEEPAATAAAPAPAAAASDAQSHAFIQNYVEAALMMATGLQHIHTKNIVHGDLNPNNVLLVNTPSPLGFVCKVADFGLSVKVPDEQSHLSNLWQGTPYYVAPEVVLSGKMSKSADVYALGIIMWEMQNGKRPPWRSGPRLPGFPLLNVGILDFNSSCPHTYKELTTRCFTGNLNTRPTVQHVIDGLKELKKQLAAPPL